MANNIKGITIQLGGDATPLTSALKDVNKASNDAQSGLKEVQKQLKFDPGNVVLSGQKVDLLKDKVSALEDKQKTLKTAVDQAHESFEKGDLGKDKVQAVEREYEKTNSQLKESKKDLLEAEAANGSFTAKVKLKFFDLKDSIKKTFSAENIKAGLGAMGVAAGAFLKGSIEEASEAQQGNADLAQSLKSTKGAAGMTMESLEDLSESLSKNTTFEDDAVKSGEAMLLTFTQIGKDVFPQATAATLDYAQKMGVDAKSAALTLGKALNDPANGLSKLTKSGVTFTDAQKKQITAMQKAGDVAGAQKLMIAELNKEFGGQAAAAADTYAGKQKQIANQVKEVKEAIGTALLPVLLKIVNSVTPIIQKIAEFVSKNPQLTAAILATVAVIGTLIGGLSLANTVAGLFGHTMQLNEILMTGGIMLAIMALIAAVALIITHWSQISTFFTNLWNTIKNTFSGVGQWFQSVFSSGANGVQSAWSGITGFFSGIWNGIQSSASATWNAIVSAVMAIITPFVAAIQGPFDTLKIGLGNILNGIQSIFSGVWEVIKNVVLGIVLVFIDLITGNFGKLGSDLSGILNNIKEGFSTVWNGIKSVVTGIAQALVGALGVIFKGGVAILQTIGNVLKTFFSGLWDGIKNTAVSVWNRLLGFFRGLPAQFASFMSGVGNAIIHGFDSAIDFIKNLPGQMLQWGKDMIQGLINGIKSMVDSVGDAVKGIGNKIRSFLHFTEPDEGPLVGFGTWMPDMMDLIVSGIKGNLGRVSSAANEVAATIAASIPTLDSSAQFHVALASASGYSATAPSKPSGTSTGSFGGVGSPTINQYFSGKVPTPSEYARQSRRSWQEALLKSKRG